MRPLRIGVVIESLASPLRSALPVVAGLGAEGVQVDAVGDLAPNALGQTGRRELRNLLRSYNLELAALAVPLRRGLDSTEDVQPRIEHLRKVMQLAFEVGCRRVVVPCPPIPAADDDSPRARTLRETLRDLGAYGDHSGTVLALEVGFDPGPAVAGFLAAFDSGSLKVTYDPGNLVVHGHDPVANLNPLKEYLTHVHARDVRRASLSRGLQEVPLGAGDIDWLTFTASLQALDFEGFVVVEREPGPTSPTDVANGVRFLRRFAPLPG